MTVSPRSESTSSPPTWDLAHLGADECAVGGKKGLFEPLDDGVISADGFDEKAHGENGIATKT